MRNEEEQLRQLVIQDALLMRVLRAAREVDLPDWCVGAGIIRNMVWDYLHGYPGRSRPRDVDLAYFDANDISNEQGKRAAAALTEMVPEVEWDVVNQAGVHLWYESDFGHAIEPYQSVEGAIATWPETATCVAVRLLPDDELLIHAPYGLADLFNLILRRNPCQVSLELFRKRYREKRIKERWPLVRIIDELRD